MTMNQIPDQFSREKILMMRGSLILRARLISRCTRRNFFSSCSKAGSKNLSATRVFRVRSCPAKTRPNPPLPISFSTR